MIPRTCGCELVALPWIPYPYPGMTWLTLIALGMVGFAVRSRARLTRFVMVAPLLNVAI